MSSTDRSCNLNYTNIIGILEIKGIGIKGVNQTLVKNITFCDDLVTVLN